MHSSESSPITAMKLRVRASQEIMLRHRVLIAGYHCSLCHLEDGRRQRGSASLVDVLESQDLEFSGELTSADESRAEQSTEPTHVIHYPVIVTRSSQSDTHDHTCGRRQHLSDPRGQPVERSHFHSVSPRLISGEKSDRYT